jgi:hypothetical protein
VGISRAIRLDDDSDRKTNLRNYSKKFQSRTDIRGKTGQCLRISAVFTFLAAVGVVPEARFPPITAIQQVINGARELEACLPGHDRIKLLAPFQSVGPKMPRF